MDVTGHNLANVDTPGYSRQVASFQDNGAYQYWDHGNFSLGQGVSISQINRVRDAYLEQAHNGTSSDLGKASVYSDGLGRIDDIYGEPSNSGISAGIDKLFNSFSGLASDPSGAAAKAGVKSAGQDLADGIRSRWADMDQLSKQAQDQISTTTSQINDLAATIAKLNQQIVVTSVNGAPNDLMDQRDSAVNQLSQLVDIHTTKTSNGSIAISAGGFGLVDGDHANKFPSQYDAASSTVSDGTSTFSVRGGQLAGLFGTLDQSNRQKATLDNLANTLRTQVNKLHESGKGSDGTTGIAFFNDSNPQHGAIDFNLSDAIKNDPTKVMSSVTGKPGDGGLAQALSDMRSTAQPTLGKQTISDFFKTNLAAIASDANYQKNQAATYSAVASQTESQIAANSGVSVDEEMVNMTKLQRAYQASAKMMTIFDQVLQQTIDMVVP